MDNHNPYVVAEGKKVFPSEVESELSKYSSPMDKATLITKSPQKEISTTEATTKDHSTIGKKEEKVPAVKIKKMNNNIIYWRNPVQTGLVFGSIMSYLICLAIYPTISVFAYTGLTLISGMVLFRMFITAKALTHKTDEQHPFKPYLEKNLKVESNRIHRQVDEILKHVEKFLAKFQHIILVENFFYSLKFALLLWALTYVGAYISAVTFVMLVVIGIFTLPKIYESFKPQIDQKFDLAQSKMKHAKEFLHDKLHQLKKKAHIHSD
jgi:hypothetical protein